MRSVVINQPATYPARPIHGALVSGFVAVHLDKSVFPARYLRTLRDIDYEIDLDLEEVRGRPDPLFRAAPQSSERARAADGRSVDAKRSGISCRS